MSGSDRVHPVRPTRRCVIYLNSHIVFAPPPVFSHFNRFVLVLLFWTPTSSPPYLVVSHKCRLLRSSLPRSIKKTYLQILQVYHRTITCRRPQEEYYCLLYQDRFCLFVLISLYIPGSLQHDGVIQWCANAFGLQPPNLFISMQRPLPHYFYY